MATETWYILEDGTSGDPREVAPDDSGVLKHKDGRAVAYSPHGPRSRSVDLDEERAKSDAAESARIAAEQAAKKGGGSSSSDQKDMKPEDQKKSYKTREAKGD